MASSSDHSKYKRLSSEIEEKYEKTKQTDAEYERKNRWRAEIEGTIKQLYPECNLVLTGSSASEFGSSGCDVDVSLILPPSASFSVVGPYVLQKISARFKPTPQRFVTEVNKM